jgi:hypothetical protein
VNFFTSGGVVSSKTAATFDLHVTFSGLTVLVPVGATELWALMVKHKATKPNGDVDKEHNHEACLVLPPPLSADDIFQYWSIEGLTNSFTGAATTADVSLLLRTVPGNLSKAHAFKAPHTGASGNWFDPATMDARFSARIRLVNVESVVATGGRFWKYPPWGTVRLATHVTAVLTGMTGTFIDVPISDGGTPLRVRATSDVARVGFYNLPTEELESPSEGTEPAAGKEPKHFRMLMNHLGITKGTPPKYVNPQPKHRRKEASLGILSGEVGTFGVNPYACLTVPVCPDSEPDC